MGRSSVEIGQAPGTKCGWVVPQSISGLEPDSTTRKQDGGSSEMGVTGGYKDELSAEPNSAQRRKGTLTTYHPRSHRQPELDNEGASSSSVDAQFLCSMLAVHACNAMLFANLSRTFRLQQRSAPVLERA